MQKRSAPGAFSSNDLRQRAARKSPDYGIEWYDAGSERFPKGSFRTDSERSDASGGRVHAVSPFLRRSYCDSSPPWLSIRKNCQLGRRDQGPSSGSRTYFTNTTGWLADPIT